MIVTISSNPLKISYLKSWLTKEGLIINLLFEDSFKKFNVYLNRQKSDETSNKKPCCQCEGCQERDKKGTVIVIEMINLHQERCWFSLIPSKHNIANNSCPCSIESHQFEGPLSLAYQLVIIQIIDKIQYQKVFIRALVLNMISIMLPPYIQ